MLDICILCWSYFDSNVENNINSVYQTNFHRRRKEKAYILEKKHEMKRPHFKLPSISPFYLTVLHIKSSRFLALAWT